MPIVNRRCNNKNSKFHQVKDIENKGRGIVASKQFKKGDFVVEYKGERINLIEAKKRESNYLSVGSGCYMYYFRLADKSYWLVCCTYVCVNLKHRCELRDRLYFN